MSEDPLPPVEPALEPARFGDAEPIAEMLAQASPSCVPQTAEQIADHLDEFVVARLPGGRLVGSVALRVLGDGRAEVRGLVVAARWRKTGLGRRLVEALVARCEAEGLDLVCVTRCPRFFRRLGFQDVPLETVPEKDGVPDDGGAPRVALVYRGLVEAAA